MGVASQFVHCRAALTGLQEYIENRAPELLSVLQLFHDKCEGVVVVVTYPTDCHGEWGGTQDGASTSASHPQPPARHCIGPSRFHQSNHGDTCSECLARTRDKHNTEMAGRLGVPMSSACPGVTDSH